MMQRLFISLAIASAVVATARGTSAPGGPKISRAMTASKMVGGNGGKEVAPRYCKSGVVTEVYGTVGKQKLYGNEYEVITSLGMRCSDGTDLGAMGTAKGKPFSIKNKTNDHYDEGFTSMNTISGAFLDHIKLLVDEQGHTRIRGVGEAGGKGGVDLNQLECGWDEKIIGYAGRANGAVDAIQVICGEEGPEEVKKAFEKSGEEEKQQATKSKLLNPANW